MTLINRHREDAERPTAPSALHSPSSATIRCLPLLDSYSCAPLTPHRQGHADERRGGYFGPDAVQGLKVYRYERRLNHLTYQIGEE